jgi:hypothetical protein
MYVISKLRLHELIEQNKEIKEAFKFYIKTRLLKKSSANIISTIIDCFNDPLQNLINNLRQKLGRNNNSVYNMTQILFNIGQLPVNYTDDKGNNISDFTTRCKSNYEEKINVINV